MIRVLLANYCEQQREPACFYEHSLREYVSRIQRGGKWRRKEACKSQTLTRTQLFSAEPVKSNQAKEERRKRAAVEHSRTRPFFNF